MLCRFDLYGRDVRGDESAGARRDEDEVSHAEARRGNAQEDHGGVFKPGAVEAVETLGEEEGEGEDGAGTGGWGRIWGGSG